MSAWPLKNFGFRTHILAKNVRLVKKGYTGLLEYCIFNSTSEKKSGEGRHLAYVDNPLEIGVHLQELLRVPALHHSAIMFIRNS